MGQYRISNNTGGERVVLRRKLGLLWHVAWVANYGTGIEETIMVTQKYQSKPSAKRSQKRLAEKLNVEMA